MFFEVKEEYKKFYNNLIDLKTSIIWVKIYKKKLFDMYWTQFIFRVTYIPTLVLIILLFALTLSLIVEVIIPQIEANVDIFVPFLLIVVSIVFNLMNKNSIEGKISRTERNYFITITLLLFIQFILIVLNIFDINSVNNS